MGIGILNARIGLLIAFLMLLTSCSSNPVSVDYDVSHIPKFTKQLEIGLKEIEVRLNALNTIDERSWAVGLMVQVPLIWRVGLQTTLEEVKAFKAEAKDEAILSVKVMDLRLPEESLAKSAFAVAKYELLNVSTGKLMFSKIISTEASVPATFSLSGGARRQEAVSRAVKSNIKNFVEELRHESQISFKQE